MSSSIARQGLTLVGFGLLASAIGYWFDFLDAHLANDGHDSGWLLIALVVFLLAFDLRKRLTYPDLFSASSWRALHAYLGFLAIWVFGLHINWQLPNGGFDILLATLFAATSALGVLGWILSRRIPHQLTALGQEVTYELIPGMIRTIRKRADDQVLTVLKAENNSVLPSFYDTQVAEYLIHIGGILSIFRHPGRYRKIRHSLDALRRYCSVSELSVVDTLEGLIEQKAMLDRHRALQGLLKAWVIAHVPMGFLLAILMVLHVMIAYGYSGGIR